jgi:hypothetical protein
MPEPEEKEFLFYGNVTLRGVTFLVKATDEAQAKEKAKNGHWDDYETSCGEASDWDIDTSRCEQLGGK